jgi:hypothetical protein
LPKVLDVKQQLGVRIPLGVCKQIIWVVQNYKNNSKEDRRLYWYNILFGGMQKGYNSYLGVCKSGKILIWGHTKWYISYLGVNRRVQF